MVEIDRRFLRLLGRGIIRDVLALAPLLRRLIVTDVDIRLPDGRLRRLSGRGGMMVDMMAVVVALGEVMALEIGGMWIIFHPKMLGVIHFCTN